MLNFMRLYKRLRFGSLPFNVSIGKVKPVKRKMTYANFRPAQSTLIRELNKKARNDNQLNKKWSSARSVTKSVSSAATELAYKFGQRSTIHGMNRLLSPNSGKYEKLIWLLTLILAFFGSIYVSLILSDRFNEGRFETIVDNTGSPVYRIFFPVVTICNLNRLNWARLNEAKERFLPGEKSKEKLDLFENIIGTYDDLAFANFDKFAELRNEPLHLLNDINFTAVLELMSWRCEEMLTDCVWAHEDKKCCEIFFRRRTKRGFCWAFNTLESEEGRRMQRIDPMWPWHNGGAGPTSGLNVRVHIHPEKHYPKSTNDKGIDVMITEPHVWHKDAYIIDEKTQTIVEIEPVIYFYDNDTRSVSSDQRQCVFDDERNSRDFKSLHGFIYMIENCQSECHQEYLMRFCNCSLDVLFPPAPYPACKAMDLPCLAKNNDYFLYSHQPGEDEFVRTKFDGMICKCFRNCYSLNYVNDVRPAFLPPEIIGNNSYVDLDVHFRFNTMMVYRTRLVFGWLDLMVAFGGIAGLFLGCSLISAIELAYFALIELPHFIYNEWKIHMRPKPMPVNMPELGMRAWEQPHFNVFTHHNNHNNFNNYSNNSNYNGNNMMREKRKNMQYPRADVWNLHNNLHMQNSKPYH